MNDMTHPAAEQPQLRTLLLTDLCDSTTLVERLGDAAAAELFRAHDRLVLELQQRWRGRLIDRSDGLLLLFERPIDGLGFALDYARGLRELGHTRNLRLEARAGLHVGEVLTWRNSAAAVQAGAKPLEVEGLAKPLAGRLMALARPGQILLSATAEPLTRRAARELGERAEHLLWKSHGRWRFKGLPEALEVHEVGEPGLAPLRAPKASGKAWRDIPLWRRPAALAAEVLLLVGIGIGAWFVTRPQPAIAFNERDWVVIADLQNLTSNARFDDALETALRVGLEQSRYVNVVPDMRIDDTLRLMRRDPAATRVDRDLGAQVALRSGARAVLLPTVAEVGGRLRVTVEVVDPVTHGTVFAESMMERDADSALAAIGRIGESLRGRLGETLASIERDSAPVERVTTASLDALRAYALGQKALGSGRLDEAAQHFQQALTLDPEFALAHVAIGRVAHARGEHPQAIAAMRKAAALRERLSNREALYLDATLAMMQWQKGYPEKWLALAELYPDFHQAAHNYAISGGWPSNRFDVMAEFSGRASVPQSVTRAVSAYLLGIARLGQERHADALKAFRSARNLGFSGYSAEQAAAYAARREFAQARQSLEAERAPAPKVELQRRLMAVAISGDQGRFTEMGMQAKALRDMIESPVRADEWIVLSATLGAGRGKTSVSQHLAGVVDVLDAARRALVDASGPPRESIAQAYLYAAYLAVDAGAVQLAERALRDTAAAVAESPYETLPNLAAIVRARIAIAERRPADAIVAVTPFLDGDELYLTHSVAADAYTALGRHGEAIKHLEWLVRHRGRAYAEWCGEHLLVIENVLRSNLAMLRLAEVTMEAGHPERSAKHLAAFQKAWPDLANAPELQARVLALQRRVSPK